MKMEQKFMEEIAKIDAPEIFLGVAHLLGAKLVNGKKSNNFRDFTEIFAELMEKYASLGRERKKEIYQALKAANKAKKKSQKQMKTLANTAPEAQINGNHTENT